MNQETPGSATRLRLFVFGLLLLAAAAMAAWLLRRSSDAGAVEHIAAVVA
ncbi:MAG: hypothetical protein JWM53_3909, partial [bacterium]|nr:hypothetical protein [bacterium]